MKKYIFVCVLFLFSSCSTKFLLTGSGESFDSLTKITQGEKISSQSSGGFDNKNLIFTSQEKGSEGYTNIYMKDNVLSQGVIQKTEGPNYNRTPNYCKANNKIAFAYWDRSNLNYDIYYVDATKGKAISQVTNTDGQEGNPCWSPDGSQIVFEKGALAKSYIKMEVDQKKIINALTIKITDNQIWIKNIDTGELKMIGNGSFPKFSPDGKQIAFVKYELNKRKTDETGTIWIMDTEGGSPKQLTNSNLGYAIQPSWSPDGNNLVFTLEKEKKKGQKSDPNIYTINITGDNLTQHTKNESFDYSPSWTSDNFIYFSSDRGSDKGDFQIFRYKIQDSK